MAYMKPKAVPAYFSLDLIPDPVVILRADATVRDLNAPCAKFLGNTRENLLGKHITEIAPLQTLAVKVNEAISSGNEDFELVLRGRRHHEVFILPFESEDGSVFVRILLKDISNFVNLEQELFRRNKELMIINDLSGTFISSQNMDLVIENLLGKILLATDFGIGILITKEGHNYKLKCSSGISPESQREIEDGILNPICQDLMGRRELLPVVDSSSLVKNSTLRREGIVFMLGVPLSTDTGAIGFLLLAGRSGREKQLDNDYSSLLSLLGNHVSLIIDKIRLFEETQRMSITDGLTGLYNTRYLYKQLDLEIARSNRYSYVFSVILFDIDNFKKLNDTHGHQAGDDVLHELAVILREVSRETDIVVRYGGEEFIIILPNTSESDAINLADRTRIAVEGNIFLRERNGGMSITLSGGIASYPQNAADARSLLDAADSAMYRAKSAGKNKVFCYKGRKDGKNIP
jgi:diguanylate cyclase (GGDEF)-like protein